MKKYLSNILIYIAALFGIVAFIGLFSTPLQIYDSTHGTWAPYIVKAYIGESGIYKGTILPIFGYVIPFAMAIFLILESFKPRLSAKLKAINTFFAIMFFLSAISVLLTKELYLSVNGLGSTNDLRNGTGPVMAAILSTLAGIILLIVTYMPGRTEIDFIEK
jgi:hypothetical protein